MKNVVKVIIGIICFVVSFTVCFHIGSWIGKTLFKDKVEEKTYTDSGLTITMEEGFNKRDYVSATFYYESQYAAMTGIKEYFEDLADFDIDGNSSLEEYAQLISYVNNKDNEYQNLNDKIMYYTYTDTISGKDFFYLTAVTKGSDAFWIINLFCEEKNKDTYLPKFEKWIATIEVE